MEIKKNLTSVNYTAKRSREIKALVIHSMWGTYAGSIQWFKNPNAGASAHYCISDLGEITQCVLDKDVAWHAGVYDAGKEPDYARGVNPNEYTIGIELEDKRDSSWNYPQEQRNAFVWLVNYLCNKWTIPLSKEYLLLHKNLNPSRRSDPVGQFSLDWVLGGSMPPEDGTNWKEKYEKLESEFKTEQQRLVDCRTDRSLRDEEITKLKDEFIRQRDDFTVQIRSVEEGLKNEKNEHGEKKRWLAETLDTTQNWSEQRAKITELIGVADLLIKERSAHEETKQVVSDMKTREQTLLAEIDRLRAEARKAKGLGDATAYELLSELARRLQNIIRRNK